MAPTYAEAAAKLEELRSEYAAIYQKYQKDTLTDADYARAFDLRAEITLLKDHMGRLERFDALVTRGR